MRLVRLKADGFGLLRGEYVFDPSRLTLLIDENERGKTSLLHAIVAGLYGLERDARRYRGLLTPIERWRPWDGGTYRIELEIESEGETYTIVRDFARGTTQVCTDRGQDVTADFLTDKDDYAVGQQLLGLDAEEFTKCAFWRQGELAEVVPELERDRRTSTLRARLESAADTRAGDASAIEAIHALDAALGRFTSPELGTTITVDNALKRLEGARDATEVELRGLENAYAGIAGPLEDIARLGEEERAIRQRLRALEARRVTLRAEDAARRLAREAERRTEIEGLRAEATALGPLAGVPPDAEARFAEHAARHGAIGRQLASLRSTRAAVERERAEIAGQLEAFAGSAACAPEDADRLAALAAERRRLDEEVASARAHLEAGLASVRANGIDPDRAVALLERFDAMTVEQGDLLRDQPRLALEHQTDLSVGEQLRSAARGALDEVARWKRPLYGMAWALLLLGLAAAALAAIGNLPVLPIALAAGGLAASAAGAGVWFWTWRARRDVMGEALGRVAAAEGRLRQAGNRAAENDTRLQALAVEVGYESAADLMSDWRDEQRLRDLHLPVRAAEQQILALERQIQRIAAAADPLLARAGGGNPTPEGLDAAAARIRHRIERETAQAAAARRITEIDAEIRTQEEAGAEAEWLASEVIAAAGLHYQPGGSWSAWRVEVQEQVRHGQRHRTLVEEEIPARERELLDAATIAALEEEAARATAETTATEGAAAADDPAAPASSASVAEIETLVAQAHASLDALRDQREERSRRIHATVDRYHADHPGLVARLESVTAELSRARRFRDAVLHARETIERVARDTHRRWAEFLNRRVGELLGEVGANVTRVRFGEDLDFSVTPVRGTPTARGKVVHQLSTGARDQLHLAVRLAISEFLSRGRESLPLLIDDCFATSDDERTRAGMRLLLDGFSRQHQIVFVTCHRHRYAALAERDHALWADRVRVLELSAGVAEAV